jgi:hypothetical protein
MAQLNNTEDTNEQQENNKGVIEELAHEGAFIGVNDAFASSEGLERDDEVMTSNIDETDPIARDSFKEGANFIIEAIKQGFIKI